jgi:hypothetical protein
VRDFFDIVPKALALLSSIVLFLTVVHEWGYFWIVGSHFQAIESAYDYLSNSILWLPQNLIFIVVITVMAVVVTRYGLGIKFTKESLTNQGEEVTPITQRQKKILKTIVICSQVLMALLLLFSYFFSPAPFMSGVIAICIFGILTTLLPWMVITDRIFKNSGPWTVALVIGPAIFFADFAVGVGEAMHDLHDFQNVYIFSLKDADNKPTSKSIPVQVLRSFDKGLLARDPNANQIMFVRWDIIRSIYRFGSPASDGSAGCREFPRLCNLPTP